MEGNNDVRCMMTWGAYLCRGIGSYDQFEQKPHFDPTMYAKGVNSPFYNLEGKPAAKVVSDFEGRFENRELRDIARAESDIVGLLKQYGGLTQGTVVVDFGSGTGLFLKSLSEAVGKKGFVLATEISSVFRDHLQKRVAKENLNDNVRVVFNQDARDPCLHAFAGKVDLVFVCDVYHHIEFPFSVMRNIRSALNPDTGRLVVIDFIRDNSVHTSHPEDPNWIMRHVRAGQEVFRSEILSCGFDLVAEPACPFIPENYVLVFKPCSPEKWATQVGTGWGSRKH